MPLVVVPIIVIILTAVFFYWLFIITEGAYLGPKVVALLYDWSAGYYDRIKDFNADDDNLFLGWPLIWALNGVDHPLVLDVATGTARLPLALLRYPRFTGQIVGLDLSRRMLQEARHKTKEYSYRLHLLWKDASCLPFADEIFDAVTCLEALEFLPNPLRALAEMVRVLRVGGLLLITNRIGWEAYLLPGRAYGPGQLKRLLVSLPLTAIEIKPWQTTYDLVWARKVGAIKGRRREEKNLEKILHCAHCMAPSLVEKGTSLTCPLCRRIYPIEDDVVCLEGS